jgi:hypothetical protein
MTKYVVFVLTSCLLIVSTLVSVQEEIVGDTKLAELRTVAHELAYKIEAGSVCSRKPHIVFFLNEARRGFTHKPMLIGGIVDSVQSGYAKYLFISAIEYSMRQELRGIALADNPNDKLIPIAMSETIPFVMYESK